MSFVVNGVCCVRFLSVCMHACMCVWLNECERKIYISRLYDWLSNNLFYEPQMAIKSEHSIR